jgi:hypothetical protein
MKSLADITILEKAYECGARSLGDAALALKARWDAGLRDQETFIRLAFLCWYSQSEPGYLTGLDETEGLPSVEDLYSIYGGAAALEPDSLFVLALLSHGYAFCCGDEATWQSRSGELFTLAAERAPFSSVTTNWRYLLGLTEQPEGLRKDIDPELHARFSGRGYMGSYVLHICTVSRSGS